MFESSWGLGPIKEKLGLTVSIKKYSIPSDSMKILKSFSLKILYKVVYRAKRMFFDRLISDNQLIRSVGWEV